jgi:DNA invertase Pin-like site-specific DNA recombinase
VQRGLTQRAEACDWHPKRILVIEGDLGESASLPGQREGFERLLELVRNRQVGIIFASDVSRLARNDLDWSMLTYGY